MNATTIRSFAATDLVGRLAVNSHGAEFVITNLVFDAATGGVIIEIDELDDHGHPAGLECGLTHLRGWTIG